MIYNVGILLLMALLFVLPLNANVITEEENNQEVEVYNSESSPKLAHFLSKYSQLHSDPDLGNIFEFCLEINKYKKMAMLMKKTCFDYLSSLRQNLKSVTIKASNSEYSKTV